MNENAPRRSRIWGSTLWGVALFFCLFPTLFFPPHRDAATFWLMGNVIRHGQMPYVALWDLKPPGIYLLYALPASIGATPLASWVAVRMLDLLLLGMCVGLLASIAARLLGPELRAVAALWLIILYLTSNLNSMAQAETWANPFWLLGWWFLLGPVSEGKSETGVSFASRAPAYFWSGFATAIAFSCKPTSAAPPLGVLCIACLFLARDKKPFIKPALLWWVGFILPLAAMILWLQRDGAWHAFLEIQNRFLGPYIASARDPIPGHLIVLLFLVSVYAAHFPLAAALAFFGLVGREHWPSRSRPVLFAALLSALGALWVQNRVFEYHLQILLPLAALFITAGCATLMRLIPIQDHFKKVALFAIPLLWFSWSRGQQVLSAPLYATGHLSRAAWFDQLKPQALDVPREVAIEGAGNWLRQQARPGDTLMVWGFSCELYMWSQIPPAQRFAFIQPAAATYAPSEWKSEFLLHLRQKPPRFFVVMHDEDFTWQSVKGGTPEKALRVWTQLNGWFTPRYRRVKSWKQLDIWEYQTPKPR